MSNRMCCAGLLIACGAAASSSAQQLILAEYQFQNARVVSMGLDGSNPQTLFQMAPADWLPLGLSFNAANNTLVWMDSGGGSEMHQSALDGSGHTVLTAVSGFARGTSRDSLGRIYFSTNNLVQRMNADGSDITTIYTAPATEVVLAPRVDATNGAVYFGTEGKIKRVNLDGGAETVVVTGVSQARAIGLDIANGYIYWIDGDTITDHIARARLDNTGFEVVHDLSFNDSSGSSGLTDLLLAPSLGKMFFSDELTGIVRSANLDGTGVQIIYTSPSGLSPIAMTLTSGDPVATVQDCNGNGTPDATEIGAGAPDCDSNGVLDSCQAEACPAWVFLVDQGSNAATGSGRALGKPSSWQVFQPVDVPETWTIAVIGIDGHTNNYVGPDPITVKLFPDSGTGLTPDETVALASTTMNLRFSPYHASWEYAPLAATLAPGRYWVRIEANDPLNFAGSIHHGLLGPNSRSRGSSGNFTSFQNPIALRLIQGSACGTADFDGDGDVGTDADIEAFFACLAGNCCGTCFPGGADFNGDGDTGTDADIESFFRVLAGGPC
jgi:sugar lactone lactonase YvrE